MNITNRRHQEFTVLTGNRRRAADRVGRAYSSGRTATGLSAVGMTAKAIDPHEADFLARCPPLVQAAKERRALVAVDNTTATAYLQRPLELGVHFAVASDTKALTGHSDVLLGHVATTDAEHAAALRG